MKNFTSYLFKTFFIVLVLAALVLFTGCNTVKAVPLSYSVNEDVDVAYIYFQLYKQNTISGATFITYDGKETPKAEKFTYWSPVEVPAGQALKLSLKLLYKEPRSDFGDDSCMASCCTSVFNAFEAARDVNEEVIFNVPPLEPYVDYVISYRKGPGIPGSSYVTLIRKDTKEVIREKEYN